MVKPDKTHVGFGVATFVGDLQNLEVLSDKDDSRCLLVTVHQPQGTPLLSACFFFDDHIRCLAARTELLTRRTKARQRKMHMIAQLLDLPGYVSPALPSPPTSASSNNNY